MPHTHANRSGKATFQVEGAVSRLNTWVTSDDGRSLPLFSMMTHTQRWESSGCRTGTATKMMTQHQKLQFQFFASHCRISSLSARRESPVGKRLSGKRVVTSQPACQSASQTRSRRFKVWHRAGHTSPDFHQTVMWYGLCGVVLRVQ